MLQVVLCKFHSVFLTEDGKVLTCGHGLGGRLGHNSEQSMVVRRSHSYAYTVLNIYALYFNSLLCETRFCAMYESSV